MPGENDILLDDGAMPSVNNELDEPLLAKIDKQCLSSKVQAAIRVILSKELLASLSLSNDAVSLTATVPPKSAAAGPSVHSRHAKYMLIMGSVVGEFLKSTQLELTLSVFVKEMEYYFASNIFKAILPVRIRNQTLSDSSPVFADLSRGMSLFRIIDLVGITPYSKFGRQLQRNCYEQRSDLPGNPLENSPASQNYGEAGDYHHACTKTFLFQMLKAMEVSGAFDAQTEVAVQVELPTESSVTAADPTTGAASSQETEAQQLFKELYGMSNKTPSPAVSEDASLAHPTSAKLRQQHILLRLKRLLEEKHERELSSQIERLREKEMEKIRREFDEHYRTQLLQSQLTLEHDYKQRCAQLTDREHQLNLQQSQRQSAFEHEEHIKRSKLLAEAEKLAERERELDRRYQVRRDELNETEARLSALQTDIDAQGDVLQKREDKLKYLQSVYKDAERERRQQFEHELEQQRKHFDDERRRLQRQTEIIVARNDSLSRENDDLRKFIAGLSAVEPNNGNNTVTNNPVLPTISKQEVGSVIGPRQGAVLADGKSAAELKMELFRLEQRYTALTQQYFTLTGETATHSRHASKARHQPDLLDGNDGLHLVTKRSSSVCTHDSRRRNHAQNGVLERTTAPTNRTRVAGAGRQHLFDANVDSQRLIRDLTQHFKAQDALKTELANEIDRGMKRLALTTATAGISPTLVHFTPADTSFGASAERERTWAAAPANETKLPTPHYDFDLPAMPLTDFSATLPPKQDDRVTAVDRLQNANHAVTEAESFSNQRLQQYPRYDDGPEHIYEIRRLEKRLEVSMANDAAKRRRRKVHHKTKASEPTVAGTASAVDFPDHPLRQQQQQQPRSSSTPVAVTVPTSTAVSIPASLAFEDVQLRQLLSRRTRLDEYMFRPLPPFEAPEVSGASARSKIHGAGVSDKQNNLGDDNTRSANPEPLMPANIAELNVRNATLKTVTHKLFGSSVSGNKLLRAVDENREPVSIQDDPVSPTQILSVAGPTANITTSDDMNDEDNYISILQQQRAKVASAVASKHEDNEQIDDDAPFFNTPINYSLTTATSEEQRVSAASEFKNDSEQRQDDNWFGQLRQRQVEAERQVEISKRYGRDRVRSDNSLNLNEILDDETAASAPKSGSPAEDNDEIDAW